ncbi:MAG: cupin domain-containing protein [Pseudomonadota bacterium]
MTQFKLQQKYGYPSRAMICLLTSLTLIPSSLATPVVETLLQTKTAWNGDAIAYPKGPPQITATLITLEQGEQTPYHCHPVLMMAYILSGSLRVETQDGDSKLLVKGDALVEVMNTPHRGTVIDGPAEILVFYAGTANAPHSVSPDSDEAALWECQHEHSPHVSETKMTDSAPVNATDYPEQQETP